MKAAHKTKKTWHNLKTGKWWIPTLETIWRAPAKGRHLAPSSSALHRSRSIWRCRHDLPGCTWLLWERSNGRKCVRLCSFAVRHISLYSLCPKWKNWLYVSNWIGLKGISLVHKLKAVKKLQYHLYCVLSILLWHSLNKRILIASQKHHSTLWSPTSLAAPALSRWFCSQHYYSAEQLYHELSLTKRGHASSAWVSAEYFTKIYTQKCYSSDIKEGSD